jgi:hypothetical protein
VTFRAAVKQDPIHSGLVRSWRLSGAERDVSCPQCGRSFAKYRRRQTYCSGACARSARRGKPLLAARRREIRACELCGRSFEVGGHAAARSKRWCSRKCARVAHATRNPPRILSPVDAAYIAAFIDGEGTITRWRLVKHRWKVHVVQKDEAVIRWLQEVTGCGSVRLRTNNGAGLRNPRRYADLLCWSVHGWTAAAVLRQVLPYMHVKRTRAEEMLTYYALAEEIRTLATASSDPRSA